MSFAMLIIIGMVGAIVIFGFMSRLQNNKAIELGAIERVAVGRYLSGLPQTTISSIPDITCAITENDLIFLTFAGAEIGRIPRNAIHHIVIDEEKKNKQYSMTIECQDTNGIKWKTVFQFTGLMTKTLANHAANAISKCINQKSITMNHDESEMDKLTIIRVVKENAGLNTSEAQEYISSLTKEERMNILKEYKASSSQIEQRHISSEVSSGVVFRQVNYKIDEEIRCPECHSNQITYDRQKYGVGKAAVGILTLGAIGLLAGGIGRNKVLLTCLKCGHAWKAGKA